MKKLLPLFLAAGALLVLLFTVIPAQARVAARAIPTPSDVPSSPTSVQPPSATSEQPPSPTSAQPPAPTSAQPPAPTSAQPPAPTTDVPGASPVRTPPAAPPLAPSTAAPSPTDRPSRPPDDDSDRQADLRITKRAQPQAGRPGDFIVFQLEISNRGGSTARNVSIGDTLPSFLEVYFVETSRGLVSNQGQNVTVQLDELAVGDVVTVSIRARIRDDATPQQSENIATVTADTPDDNTQDNTSRVPVEVQTQDLPTATVLLGSATATALPGSATATALPGSATALVPATTPVIPAALPTTGTSASASWGWLALWGLLCLSFGLAVMVGRGRLKH